MKINLMNIKAHHNELKSEINQAVSEILDSCNFILGENVRGIENEIAQYCGVRYGVGVANGTDALIIGLRALGIGSGDEVITSAYTFYATAEAIAAVGAKPVFAEIEETTMNIDPESVKQLITNKTKAIMPVHIFGHPAQMDEICEIANDNNLVVIEDACQAIGARYKDKIVGGLANGAAFSFFPSKNLSCAGDGGMFVTDDEKTAKAVKMFRFHGSEDKSTFYEVGYNSRLDELQAAILRVKFKQIDKWNENRRNAAHIYTSKLKGYVEVPVEEPWAKHVYHLYVIRSPHRKIIQEKLKDNDIASAVYYGNPLHLQPVFKDLGYKQGDLPVTETSAGEGLALPMHPFLSEKDAEEVCSVIINTMESLS